MCDCKTRIEAKLTEHHRTSHPEATEHAAELGGYSITLGEVLRLRPYAEATLSAKHKAKSGSTNVKKKRMSMMFSFCPFCAEPIES